MNNNIMIMDYEFFLILRISLLPFIELKESPEDFLFIDDMLHLLQLDHLGHCQDFHCIVTLCSFVLNKEKTECVSYS